MFRLALFLLLLGIATAAPAGEDFYARLIAFDKHYNRFIHRLCGWPADGPGAGPCRESLGVFDFREFRLAGEMAEKLWAGKEKDHQ